MFFKLIILIVISSTLINFVASKEVEFTYHGFKSANLSIHGAAEITPNGILRLTNETTLQTARAVYSMPVNFKDAANGSVFSFSTTFVFAIVPVYSVLAGHGMTFAISPVGGLAGALPSPYLGLFNDTNNGESTNHVVAVELDTLQNKEFFDINGNHVGIDINSLKSNASKSAGYYDEDKNGNFLFRNLTLASSKPMQVWVEYDGRAKQMNVTMAPLGISKPKRAILSFHYDISLVLHETMSVGFTAATGSVASTQYLLGWSFKMNGVAPRLDPSRLPKLPRIGPKRKPRILVIGVPIISIVSFVVILLGIVYYIGRKMKFAELLEDWELEFGPHRFKYKDLYYATKGFSEKELLGAGGFGMVYRGVLSSSNLEIAVKRVSHGSRQGMREFVAEIVSIGRLRHRNLVPLLGYCRRKGELLLVYEYMPYGSLDKILYDNPKHTLSWGQRFGVIKGVASGLLYLHEEWEKLVIHRDVKASNVLLDGELNGRLGDFGLARLYDHGTDPQTTHLVGTIGYLAPEHTRTGKATTSTDVYAFGAFLLEVVCGKRPLDPQLEEGDALLVDRVFSYWSRGEILKVVDSNLGADYVVGEVELVLKLGLICSQYEPMARPSMRQVVLYLQGALPLPELSLPRICSAGIRFGPLETFELGSDSSSGTTSSHIVSA